MKKTIPELEKENKELSAKIVALTSENNNYKAQTDRMQVAFSKAENLLASKDELLDALTQKYIFGSQEKRIVAILEEGQIPEQVSVIKQITAKKLIQFRTSQAKHQQAADFYKNNVNDMESNLHRAANGDITTLPA